MNIHIPIVILYTKLSIFTCLTKGQRFDIKNGKIDIPNPAVWVHDVSFGGCVDECKFRSSCTALNYHQFVNLCQLDLTPSPEVVPTKERGLLYWIKTTQEDHVECGQHSCRIGFVCNIQQNTCEVKECSPLSIPSNTIILGNVNAIGAKIKMRCKEGYFATGLATITLTCETDGAWSPEPLICKSATVGSACTVNNECADTTTTFCDTSAAEGQCRKKFGQPCATDSDCPNNGKCSSSTCACASGFEQEGELCKGQIISQWVERVDGFSSERTVKRRAANQIVGEPDVYPEYRSDAHAWAPSRREKASFIVVVFSNIVNVTTVEIFETFRGGLVTGIICFQDEVYHSIYVGTATLLKVARTFSPTLTLPCVSNRLRIEVTDETMKNGYRMEIDAIRLNGTLIGIS